MPLKANKQQLDYRADKVNLKIVKKSRNDPSSYDDTSAAFPSEKKNRFYRWEITGPRFKSKLCFDLNEVEEYLRQYKNYYETHVAPKARVPHPGHEYQEGIYDH